MRPFDSFSEVSHRSVSHDRCHTAREIPALRPSRTATRTRVSCFLQAAATALPPRSAQRLPARPVIVLHVDLRPRRGRALPQPRGAGRRPGPGPRPASDSSRQLVVSTRRRATTSSGTPSRPSSARCQRGSSATTPGRCVLRAGSRSSRLEIAAAFSTAAMQDTGRVPTPADVADLLEIDVNGRSPLEALSADGCFAPTSLDRAAARGRVGAVGRGAAEQMTPAT